MEIFVFYSKGKKVDFFFSMCRICRIKINVLRRLWTIRQSTSLFVIFISAFQNSIKKSVKCGAHCVLHNTHHCSVVLCSLVSCQENWMTVATEIMKVLLKAPTAQWGGLEGPEAHRTTDPLFCEEELSKIPPVVQGWFAITGNI